MTEMVHGARPARPGDPVLPRWWRSVDSWSIAAVMALCGIGLLLGLAASPPLAERNGHPPFYYVSKQAVYVAVALALMLATSMLTPRMIRRLSVLGFLAVLVSLALLPVFGTDFGKGAVRWYSLGFAALQPSEFLKPLFVVFAAWLMSASSELDGPPGTAMSLLTALTVAGLLILQPDFGQAVLILFGWAVMYFVAGAPMLLLLCVLGAAIGAGALAYSASDHFARRIDGFLAETVDPSSQLGFATNAIREGGYFGVGVGEGQVKWSLPDAHTDFIIAVAAEEYGLMLVLAVILLYLAICIRAFLRLIVERDPFIRLAGAGIAALIGAQAVINMGVAVRMLPAKGMTLPFVSYGGSSMLAGGLALGILLALTRERPQGAMADLLRGRVPR
jgi:cell division protein FtsW